MPAERVPMRCVREILRPSTEPLPQEDRIRMLHRAVRPGARWAREGHLHTHIPTAPASIIALLNEPNLDSCDVSSVRVVITGGASCPVETLRALRRRMSGHLIHGMLETGHHTYTRISDDAA